MDKYEAAKSLATRVSTAGKPIQWCSKVEFAKTYKNYTGLSYRETNRVLTDLNKSYNIVWYHTKGFIFSFSVKNKVKPRSKMEIDWGTYYLLFHLDYYKDLFTIGGNFKTSHAIHPNIYRKGGYQFYCDSMRICLSPNMQYINYIPLLKSGGIHSYLDQAVGVIRANDGNGLIHYFDGLAYARCRACGDYIHTGENKCEECSKEI